MPTPGFVYMMASQHTGTLYVGVTSSLLRRVAEHKAEATDGFTQRYHVRLIVHFEAFSDIRDALVREKQIKKWRRAWKIALIEQHNPTWRDLYPSLLATSGSMHA